MKGSKDTRSKHDSFKRFRSDEELREAIDNLRRYLEALRGWDEIEKKQRIIPPEMLN